MDKSGKKLYAVIIAGGFGERFWPRSRAGRPKQFLPIAGGSTMLEATVERIRPVIPPERIFVCTGREFSREVSRLAPEIPPENVISEPCGRNTAAAVGLSAVGVGRVDRESVMAVLPADHLIEDEELFRKTLLEAAGTAGRSGSLVVFGVEPERPATGYGYIKAGGALPGEDGVFIVDGFLEKPDEAKARKFLADGSYYWNSGMFVWTYRSIMSEIEAFLPELHSGLLRIEEDPGCLDEVYEGLSNVSVDHGIMEKTSNTVMVRGRFGWGDIGSWDALDKAVTPDARGNVVRAENHKLIDSAGNVVVSDGTLVAAVGVEDLIVVVDDDAVLVCRKDRAEDVKRVVEELKKDGKLEKFVR